MKFLSDGLHPFVKVLLTVAVLMCCFSVAAILSAAAVFEFADFASSTSGMLFLQAASTVLIFGTAFVVCESLFAKSEKGFWSFKVNMRIWIWAAVLPLATLPCIEWLNTWNESWHFAGEEIFRTLQQTSEQTSRRLLHSETAAGLFARVFAMAVLPAVCEELFFRGVFQRLCTQWFKNAVWGIVLSSAVFSFVHFEIFSFVPRFVLSCFLGSLFALSGSIWTCMLCHFVNNFIVCLVYSELITPQTAEILSGDTVFSPWIVALSVLVLFFFFVFEGRKASKKHKKEAEAQVYD